MDWFKRKPRLTPEEEYIAKLNAEAAERAARPPTPYSKYGVGYLPGGFITGGAITADKIRAGSIEANMIRSNTL